MTAIPTARISDRRLKSAKRLRRRYCVHISSGVWLYQPQGPVRRGYYHTHTVLSFEYGEWGQASASYNLSAENWSCNGGPESLAGVAELSGVVKLL